MREVEYRKEVLHPIAALTVVKRHGNRREAHHPLNTAAGPVNERGEEEQRKNLQPAALSEDIEENAQRDHRRAAFHGQHIGYEQRQRRQRANGAQRQFVVYRQISDKENRRGQQNGNKACLLYTSRCV